MPWWNFLLNGLVLFTKASPMDFTWDRTRCRSPVHVVYIFYDVSGIDPFCVWKHTYGLRTQSSAILTSLASQTQQSLLRLLLSLVFTALFWSQDTKCFIDVYGLDLAISEFSPSNFDFFLSDTGSIYVYTWLVRNISTYTTRFITFKLSGWYNYPMLYRCSARERL